MLWLFRMTFVLVIYTSVVLYTGFRLFAFGKLVWPSFKKRFFWPVYIILSFNFIFLAVFRLEKIRPLYFSGMYLLMFVMYLFGLIFLQDIVFFILFVFRKIKSIKNPRLVKIRLAGTGAALIVGALLLVYGTFHARNIRTVHYTLNFPGNSAPLKIALVSDLHIGPTVEKKWVGKIVDRINEAQPDMVCMAGDIFDIGLEGVAEPEEIARELKRINAPLGIFACQGNHDVNRRTRSLDEISNFLSAAGIRLLVDEAVPVQGSGGIYIAGRRDARPIGMPKGRLSVEELAASIPRKVDAKPFVILLDHQPIELPQAAEAGFDLVLCGHTHRGQIFPGNFVTRFIFRKAGGTHYGHWQKDNTQAVVSSGSGVWGPPVRVGTNSEVIVITVVKPDM